MFLKRLQIHDDDRLVRNISFIKGINLIVDETDHDRSTDSGNGVGKTSVLRLIDFCLDGDGKNIYTDPEFKTTNKTIEQYLKQNNIVVTLTLVDDFDSRYPRSLTIERNFLSYSRKIQRINGEQEPNESFSNRLKELIFGVTSDKPTLRQLKSKNIRDEKNKVENTLKVLNAYTTDAEYEILVLFWLGIEADSDKDKLVRDRNLEERLQARLKKESNLPQINQALIVLDESIAALEQKKTRFNLNERYESDLEELNQLKSDMNAVSTRISRLEIRKGLILESKADLEKSLSEIDADQVRRMYDRASALVPSIQRSFEETLQFHNEMIKQKMDYLTEELPNIENDVNQFRQDLAQMIRDENRLAEKVRETGVLEDLENIISELNRLYERKGNLEEQKRQWESSNKTIAQIDRRIAEINESIYSKDEAIQKRIADFNRIFSDISRRLDGVNSILSGDNSEGIYKFTIGNVEGNPGKGSKKSQMASFDLAYIKFADAFGIPCLHFILQDQIENVHSNQITSLLTEIVNEVNCQYVLPVLRDKLPGDLDLAPMEILSLSQQDKLFRI